MCWVNLATYQDTSPYLLPLTFASHYTLIPLNPEEPQILNETHIDPKKDPKKTAFITECRTNAPKALIFRDSFFINLQPYMSQYLAKTVYVWEWPDLTLLKKYMQYNQPDIVIEARVERHLKFIPIPKPK